MAVFSLDPKSIFPFELDDFQYQAIAALDADKSVVVCAPTGSGKTLIGEYAIHRALARGKRVFYTTPLKALSNQKLRDFRQQFGTDQVGLLTGDISINRDAPVIVMTTEIFRNMLYGTPIGEVGTSLVDLDTVVLDECHYMNDRQRGTVWEESIIYCPAEVQLVALSATVENSDQLTDWIDTVHGPTELIYSDFRPVPLAFNYGHPKGIFPLLNETGDRMNPRLKPKGGTHRPRGANRRGMPRAEAPTIPFIVTKLREKNMLPAIYFIFSRRNCNKALEGFGATSLVSAVEREAIDRHIADFTQRHPEAVRAEFVEPLRRGLAAHHAGILPAWKGFVEELFQQALVKVVFATETLAAGINMPARTTVIASLSKRTDAGHRLLNASEFLQMSGRAGRRGMDTQGYVVTLQTPFEGAREAARLAMANADPLVSQFTPTYGMVLNLLQMHTLEEVRSLIERSFGQYLSTLYLKPQKTEIQRCATEVDRLRSALEQVDFKQLEQYEKIRERLREEKRLLKILQQQAAETQAETTAMSLEFAVSGSLLTLRSPAAKSANPMPAVLVMKATSSGKFPLLVCLGQNNRWYVVATTDVVALHGELPRLKAADTVVPPLDLLPKPGQSRKGDELSLAVAKTIPDAPALEELAPEVHAQMQRMLAVQAQMDEHPMHTWGDRGKVQKQQRRLVRLEEELDDRQGKLVKQSQQRWQEFLGLIEILEHFGCLEDFKPTRLGEATAAIRGDNELWLGLALMSGEFDHLGPHHLAACCAALVVEVSRPDTWTRYGISENTLEALEGVRGIRRQVFQQQRRREIMLPVWFELDLIGLVEQWALGTEWLELCENTSLDEGDVVRILRRTLDFLSQIPHVPHAPRELKDNAVRAMQLIDRFPINETVG
ncbi:DEAD/DEAH box helicase [filamentous cyanobacterium LEGE 11480]|uniref:DEAD/DEAH box helicase n=1 Tax=Romeriopsis navalis LEGE 11480 TaxID=2777977 RepID=A0A928VM85_9CYAN|nr:DEAD/DEAH box helicase [Romeriopsis navalis]MBE9029095.1 DEAD/DEAH box helicase [Romeriopsis navalis LEGE 11480]